MKHKKSKSSTGRLSWMLSGVLKSKRAEGYVDTAVKVLIAVVIGALLLFGLYGLMGNIVIPTTTSKVDSMFKLEGHFDGGAGGGGTGGGDTPVTPTPEIKREAGSIIPDGAKYTKADGATLDGNGTNIIPDVPATNDTYEEGDYIYTYNKGNSYGTEWSVAVKDNAKSEYGVILSGIANKPVTNMYGTFQDCTSLVTAPAIPSSVETIDFLFYGCTALVSAPVIPDGVTTMAYVFKNCTLLTAAPKIPDSVKTMNETFKGCTSLTTAPILPNGVTLLSGTFGNCTALTTAPVIPNTVKDMGSIFSGCESLKTYIGSTDSDGDFSNYKIPGAVTKMASSFTSCALLTVAPDMSNANSVTDMSSTFTVCTSLVSVSTLPSKVANMQGTFYGCTSLTTIPAIPNSVTNMNVTFNECVSLKGQTIKVPLMVVSPSGSSGSWNNGPSWKK